ncbi:type 1 periplasmic binding fold superfamily protein [Winogradskyella sp. MIT101101]|uniref:type 1 periplasmic binding fold superfamily protein n=1 Tax=Winogradskyella sp. MIT101101 TaxID=3098297 RepID=UPI00399A7980
MKKILIVCITLGLVTSCSDDDNPALVNQEEVITTLTLTLSPQGGGTDVVFQSRDADGDGPDAPVITVSSALAASTAYTGSVEFLNELENPAEDITEEVEEEADEHQVFYNFLGTSGSSVTYDDMDGNGNPLGVNITLNSGSASTGNTLTVTLKHEPTKPNDGTANGAGGETDIEASFSFDVN